MPLRIPNIKACAPAQRASATLGALASDARIGERRLVMGRHEVPWLNASTAAASNLEELAYHYGTDKSHDDHKCTHRFTEYTHRFTE